MSVSITGLNEAKVLAALFNASRPQGMGFLHYKAQDMTEEQAAELLKRTRYFDYLQGRVMKIEIKDPLDEWGYDRDNGQGAVQRVIDALRKTDAVVNETVQNVHAQGVKDAAIITKKMMGKESVLEVGENMTTLHMGLSDVADVLGPKVDAAVKGVE